jgi:hypothetical protein
LDKEMTSTSTSGDNEETASDGLKCHFCGKKFDDMAEMQRHVLTEHMQKGDFPVK